MQPEPRSIWLMLSSRLTRHGVEAGPCFVFAAGSKFEAIYLARRWWDEQPKNEIDDIVSATIERCDAEALIDRRDPTRTHDLTVVFSGIIEEMYANA
jgi:hypothetical protein